MKRYKIIINCSAIEEIEANNLKEAREKSEERDLQLGNLIKCQIKKILKKL